MNGFETSHLRPVRAPDPGAEAAVIEAARAHIASRARGVIPGDSCDDAWEHFLHTYGPMIHTLVLGYSPPGDRLEDGVQDVWEALLAHLPRFRYDPARGPFRAWLAVLVRRVLSRRSRRRPVERLTAEDARRLPGREPDPADAEAGRQARAEVRAALLALRRRVSETTYQVVYLRWIEERTAADVAARLGLTPAQVGARNHRALAKLREILGRDGGPRHPCRVTPGPPAEKIRKSAQREARLPAI